MSRLAALALLVALAACGPGRMIGGDAADAAFKEGLSALKAGEWARAEQYFLAAKTKYPDNPYLWLDLGVVWENLGQYGKARGAYQKTVETGADVVPGEVTDPTLAGRSLADIAKANLARLPR